MKSFIGRLIPNLRQFILCRSRFSFLLANIKTSNRQLRAASAYLAFLVNSSHLLDSRVVKFKK